MNASVLCCAFGLYVPFLYASCFSFNATSPTEIYTLSLHDALPISPLVPTICAVCGPHGLRGRSQQRLGLLDRKSTRLNSSHRCISYAVFCLKKKKHLRHRLRSARQLSDSSSPPPPAQYSYRAHAGQ